MIRSVNLYGENKFVPKSKLSFRPAVYGIIINDGKILLTNTRSTGKYFFPGGALELDEKLEDALRREVREETGIEIRIEKLFHFKENFFYYDPSNEAYHNFSFFYICKPMTLTPVRDDQVMDGEAEKPRWVELNELRPEKLQSFAGEVLELFQKNYLQSETNNQKRLNLNPLRKVLKALANWVFIRSAVGATKTSSE